EWAAGAKGAEVTKGLRLPGEVERWQLKVDEIISELSQLDNQLSRTAQLEAALKEAEAAHAGAPSAESLGLPADIADRAKRFAQLVAKRDDALAKLDSDSGAELSFGYVEPLKQNVRFWVAVGLGAGSFLAGVLLPRRARCVRLPDHPPL